jgi:PKD repeat protein
LVPLVTAAVSQFIWDFGDNAAPQTDQTPSHTYTLPGSYTVKLVVSGWDGMVVTKIRTAFVTVTANRAGEPCSLNSQCEEKLTCLCGADTPCDLGPSHGFCAASCVLGSTHCDDGQVCAGLASPTSLTRQDWQAPLCLRACTKDTDCTGPLHCRRLPPGPGDSSWVQGCFGDLPADVGGPCLDAKGALRDDLCVSGICANLGLKGLCTAACSKQSCPPGSDCAVLGDGRQLCLRPCLSGFACADDPLLECVVPGLGDLGYHLVSWVPTAASYYCAPKACQSDDQCTPSGKCDSPSGNGHCIARTD